MLPQISQPSASVLDTLNLSRLHSKHYLIFMVSIKLLLRWGAVRKLQTQKHRDVARSGRGNVKIALERRSEG